MAATSTTNMTIYIRSNTGRSSCVWSWFARVPGRPVAQGAFLDPGRALLLATTCHGLQILRLNPWALRSWCTNPGVRIRVQRRQGGVFSATRTARTAACCAQRWPTRVVHFPGWEGQAGVVWPAARMNTIRNQFPMTGCWAGPLHAERRWDEVPIGSFRAAASLERLER